MEKFLLSKGNVCSRALKLEELGGLIVWAIVRNNLLVCLYYILE
jgi:hypothetical protein